MNSQLLSEFLKALEEYKDGSGLEKEISAVLFAIRDNFYEMKGNFFERINLGKDDGKGLIDIPPIEFSHFTQTHLVKLAQSAMDSVSNVEDFSPETVMFLKEINTSVRELLEGSEQLPRTSPWFQETKFPQTPLTDIIAGIDQVIDLEDDQFERILEFADYLEELRGVNELTLIDKNGGPMIET